MDVRGEQGGAIVRVESGRVLHGREEGGGLEHSNPRNNKALTLL